ncbi:hypothetical protein ACIBI9_19670 [Nonomuraea sp. NPDC050451]|uniref:hypothetical protein n=1 Tax=Nonomuraea sp. NPDC050451 TaxID=3364364 RepID=UPI00379CF623
MIPNRLELRQPGVSVPVTGQQGSWLWARDFDGIFTHTVTVQVANRDTFAEIALFDDRAMDKELHVAKCAITQIVSASGVENWDIGLTGVFNPNAFRRNVTSITFGALATNSRAAARWTLTFWS